MERLEPLNLKQSPRALVWVRSGLSVNSWKLVCRGRIYATMTYFDRDQSRALLQTAAGSWEIDLTFGGVPSHAAIREVESGREIAALRTSSTGNGRIDFVDAAAFRWRGEAMAISPALLTTVKGGPIAKVNSPVGAVPNAVMIELEDDAYQVGELPILLGLGLYSMLRHSYEAFEECESLDLADTVSMAG